VKGVIDGFLADHIPPPNVNEERIARIEQLIAQDGGSGEVSDWNSVFGLGSPRTLARTCECYFGFGPKVLQRRYRFLRVSPPCWQKGLT
jgi:hypothetical protein